MTYLADAMFKYQGFSGKRLNLVNFGQKLILECDWKNYRAIAFSLKLLL